MSKSDMPPVPPANRSPKGPGDHARPEPERQHTETAPENTKQQGQQGNIHQNTTHQGYQQDR